MRLSNLRDVSCLGLAYFIHFADPQATKRHMLFLEVSALISLEKHLAKVSGQRGRVVSALDSRSGGRGFDSRPCHVAIALGKQFTITFSSLPTLKMGTQLQAIL
ncbi:hypothetical protein ElyMa_005880800 [Elysia marginata]|uniref:Uncharacterized protein n=1 Tax=Elysia marginata TaxID=1093978 RepID=A0AAV4G3S2_9GAST|nr:hypothetical protein ElyMa_005880800 [Elysia marginata]